MDSKEGLSDLVKEVLAESFSPEATARISNKQGLLGGNEVKYKDDTRSGLARAMDHTLFKARSFVDPVGKLALRMTPGPETYYDIRDTADSAGLLIDAIKQGDTKESLKQGGLTGVNALFAMLPFVGGIGAVKAANKITDGRLAKQQHGVFGGIKAKNAPLDDLTKAKGLIDEGVDPKKVWKETGWYKSPWDEKWKFEIPDNDMSLTKLGNKRLEESLRKRTTGLQAERLVDHRQLQENYPDMMKRTTLKYNTEHPLENFYKEKKGGSSAGSIQVSPIPRKANDNLADATNEITLHELQHAVQNAEGFSKGGKPADLIDKAIQKSPDIQELEAKLKSFDKAIEYKKTAYMYSIKNKNLDKDTVLKKAAELIDGKNIDNRAIEIARAHKLPSDISEGRLYIAETLQDELESATHGIYKALPGEAEARLVQKRMNYSPEKRIGVYPLDDLDVPLEDVMAMKGQGGGLSMSVDDLPMDEASRMQRAKESYDVDKVWYHGTQGPIDEFKGITYFTEDAAEASGYASRDAMNGLNQPWKYDQPNVMPVYLKKGKANNIDNEILEAVMEGDLDETIKKELVRAKKEGKDFIEFYHPTFDGNTEKLVRIPVDPKNVRSKFAKFDPAKKDSSNLLAGVGGLGLLGLAGLSEQQNYE